MRSVFSARLWTPVTCAALIVGCSSPAVRLSPQPVLSYGPTTAPTAGASATPTPAPGHTATPTPAPVHTATPTPVPTSTSTGETGNIETYVCPAPEAAVPGNAFIVASEGIISGGTFTQDPYVSDLTGWEYESVTVASPTPVPTATPIPTATPTAGPTASPIPYVYNIYEGTYSVSAFSGTATPSGSSTSAPYSVAAQTGCFVMAQEVSGPTETVPDLATRLARVRVAATANPADNTFGEGETNESTDNFDESTIASGSVTSFGLSGLSVPDGAGGGSFVLDSGGTGTVTIQASGTLTYSGSDDAVRRVRAKIASLKARYRDFRR